jgi:hypothetical protein
MKLWPEMMCNNYEKLTHRKYFTGHKNSISNRICPKSTKWKQHLIWMQTSRVPKGLTPCKPMINRNVTTPLTRKHKTDITCSLILDRTIMTKAKFVNGSTKRSMWNVNKTSPKSSSQPNIYFLSTLTLAQGIRCRITNILINKCDVNIYTYNCNTQWDAAIKIFKNSGTCFA